MYYISLSLENVLDMQCLMEKYMNNIAFQVKCERFVYIHGDLLQIGFFQNYKVFSNYRMGISGKRKHKE